MLAFKRVLRLISINGKHVHVYYRYPNIHQLPRHRDLPAPFTSRLARAANNPDPSPPVADDAECCILDAAVLLLLPSPVIDAWSRFFPATAAVCAPPPLLLPVPPPPVFPALIIAPRDRVSSNTTRRPIGAEAVKPPAETPAPPNPAAAKLVGPGFPAPAVDDDAAALLPNA